MQNKKIIDVQNSGGRLICASCGYSHLWGGNPYALHSGWERVVLGAGRAWDEKFFVQVTECSTQKQSTHNNETSVINSKNAKHMDAQERNKK